MEGKTILKEGQPDGLATIWYDNGTKKNEGSYQMGKRVGKWLFWEKNGEIDKEEAYENGNLIYTRSGVINDR